MGGAGQRARRIPDWPEVRRLLERGDPQTILLEGTVPLELRVDGERGTTSLRCPVDGPADLRGFGAPEELILRSLDDPDPRLEISVADIELVPHFLGFVETVVDAIQLQGAEATGAIQTSMRLFRRLLRDVHLLSRERVLGLLGELWVLNRLIDAGGGGALESWTGPRGEAHDFRIGGVELEVKTTARQRRVHLIHGLDQLEPSPGADLHLVSLQLASGGAASESFSLAERLAATRKRLDGFGRGEEFGRLVIGRHGIAPEDEHRYDERFRLRSAPVLIKVDESFPRLTRDDIDAAPNPEMHRVVEVEYEVDVEGLGVADGAPEFTTVLPAGGADE
jgi:hypothetical protein